MREIRDRFTEAHNNFTTILQTSPQQGTLIPDSLQPALNQMAQAFYEAPPSLRMSIRMEMIEAAGSGRDYGLKPVVRLKTDDVLGKPGTAPAPAAQMG